MAESDKLDILIIDDEESILRMLSVIFENEGYSVDTAANSESGLSIMYRLKPKILVLDVMMPGMDGIDLLHYIKNDMKLFSTKVVMLSAKRDFDLRIFSIEAGAECYITKPFDCQIVLDILSDLFNSL